MTFAVEPDLAMAFERRADLFGDRVAIAQGETRISWQEFDSAAARLAGFLSSRGVTSGDRVAIGARNCPEYLIAIYAAAKLRAVPVNVNVRYRQQELEHVLGDSDSVVLVHDEMLEDIVPHARANLPALHTVISVGTSVDLFDGSIPIPVALAGPPQPRGVARPEVPWLLYTGGTTGAPKAVVQPHAEGLMALLESQAYAPRGLVGPTDLDDVESALSRIGSAAPVVLAAPPLMHGTALYGSLSALMAGGVCVLLSGRQLDASELLGLIPKHGVTDLLIVGDAFGRPIIDTLAEAAEARRPFDVSTVRLVCSAGVPWSAEVKARMLDYFDARFIDVVAATEGGPYAVSIADRRTPFQELASFRLASAARLLVPATSVEASPGQPGLLAAPAPAGAHYAGDPVRTAATFREIEGRLYSVPGDLARVDESGVVTLLGRGAGVINTGGEKVYPREVEDALGSHDQVAEAVVMGIPDSRWGTAVAAVVVAEPGCHPTVPELQSHVTSIQADYKKPRRIVVVTEMKRTAAGKADLRWARGLLEGTQHDE